MDISTKIKAVSEFIKIDIWRSTDRTGWKGFRLRVLKILVITAQEFKKDKIVLQASALTYLTILSIVPVVAMLIGISKGFGIEKLIRSELDKIFFGQEVVRETIFEFAQNMLNNNKGDLIIGISIVVLFFTVMKLLNNIEEVFNSIWGKLKGRNIIRKFTDYLAIIVISPVLIILSSGVTIFVQNQLQLIGRGVQMESVVSPLAAFFVQLSSYVLIWLLFTMIYVIMPNTKVKIGYGLIAGVIAGTLFQLLQKGFITFSFLMGNYGAVYGGLAVLPLFFIFCQLSWVIVCIGGELSYAIQKVDEYIPDEKEVKFSMSEKNKIALVIVHTIVKAFENDEEPWTKKRLAICLEIPHRFVSNTVNRLVSAGILSRSLSVHGGNYMYLPALDINKIDINLVLRKLEEDGERNLHRSKVKTLPVIEESLKALYADLSKSKDNKCLKDI
ncbi:YihY/virulence factor BrkB family protein [Reichenbachiella carrageenanivorans]|uniref:YihY/virulence factor BrkB family protein n=1 Tax=Reichenbachiella carrageenanivorans TaxID=2979869 RepID=A0ABY6CV30_9BACT|nr:YihY/virulence factor BrkB family protein [Reichenbachiella carrageenanivorans]UXX77781.1 YihY/virulence factor BrkB family protein [Reichenbachiella carrageenanivorans]